jgi:cell wall-associated NlpC family hydrolase
MIGAGVVLGGFVTAAGAGLSALIAVVSFAGPVSAGAGTAGALGAPGPIAAVPAAWELLEQQAAATCPGLDWSVLAAIGRVESDSGRSDLPGVASGANPAGAEGPMQFEPATFAAYAVVRPGGAVPPSPYDPVDAVYTAAALLCANGAGDPAGLEGALYDYNHDDTYVATVLLLALALQAAPALLGDAASAIAYAAAQLGTPYLYGGETPGVGFDCSGLVQAAYASGGVALPRVAQDQFDAGPAVGPGPSEPGDLVFFGSGPDDVEHVGLVLAPGVMVDAPSTGSVVRVEAFPDQPGASWGDQIEVGITRPAG